MNNELMEIKQPLILIEKFESASEIVKAKTTAAMSLVCNEDSVKQIKSVRAELNKEFTTFENARKQVKNSAMKPYNDFETRYNELIKNAYTEADKELKVKIEAVENQLKQEKADKVKAYYDEMCQSYKIDFIPFERSGVNVTLSASEKSLKEQCKEFIDRISDDIALIETQTHADEIMVEFKATLNASGAIVSVKRRYEAIEVEKARREEQERQKEEIKQCAAKVDDSATAEEIPNYFTLGSVPDYKIFKVKIPLNMVDEIKYYLSLNGVELEEI